MKNFKFRPDAGFRICQLTDLHFEWGEDPEDKARTFALIKRAAKELNPDLFIITGDIAWGKNVTNALEDFKKVFADINVFFAPVLGNHDGQANDCDISSRADFAALLCGGELNLFEFSQDGVAGHGNYIITVGEGKNLWALYCLDTHQGDIYHTQIDWYRTTSAALPAGHSELSFFHIPLPEYIQVWDHEVCSGNSHERIAPTRYNDGLFAAMARSGAMRGVFVGHDHVNDFEGTLHGIRLCYGRVSGYQAYSMEDFSRGVRIIDLKEGEKDFTTRIWLDNEKGDIYEQRFPNKPRLTKG